MTKADKSAADTTAPGDDLYRLVYVSRNRIPGTRAEVVSEIDAILAASQRTNAALNITGALIFNSGMFAQVLEGARRDIEALIERILRDPRHGDPQVLVFDKVESRAFPDWSMGFIGRSHEDENLFTHVGTTTGFEAGRLTGDRIFNLMRTIALDEERHAA